MQWIDGIELRALIDLQIDLQQRLAPIAWCTLGARWRPRSRQSMMRASFTET